MVVEIQKRPPVMIIEEKLLRELRSAFIGEVFETKKSYQRTEEMYAVQYARSMDSSDSKDARERAKKASQEANVAENLVAQIVSIIDKYWPHPNNLLYKGEKNEPA